MQTNNIEHNEINYCGAIVHMSYYTYMEGLTMIDPLYSVWVEKGSTTSNELIFSGYCNPLKEKESWDIIDKWIAEH